jgi:hypothetical protein
MPKNSTDGRRLDRVIALCRQLDHAIDLLLSEGVRPSPQLAAAISSAADTSKSYGVIQECEEKT